LIDLSDQVYAEAVVRLLCGEHEAALQIDPPRGDQRVIDPQPRVWSADWTHSSGTSLVWVENRRVVSRRT
jgi:hypothetical protein